MKREQLRLKSASSYGFGALWSKDILPACDPCISPLERGIIEGENPVCCMEFAALRCMFEESCFLGLKRKVGGKLHLKLNICERPIANKYREGKMKRTLKRELKSA